MKLNIEKGPFLKALSHGQSVVEKRATVPVLSHVLLSANSNGLLLTTTDMDLALIETIPAQVEQAGTVCVSATLLYDIVRKLSDRSTVGMSYDPKTSRLGIRSGRSSFELSCLPAEDFPQITQAELTHHFNLPPAVLKLLVDTTRFAMSSEEVRYHLNGIHFHSVRDDNKLLLKAVATDMHRLACVSTEASIEAEDMPEVIVSKKTIQELRKLLDEAEAPVLVGLSQARVEFAIDGAQSKSVLSARLIEGTFPDYQSALAVDNDKRLIVATKLFAEAIDRVGTVVTDKVRAIRIKLRNNTMELSAVSNEFGSANEELDVDFPYDTPLEICFNVKYVMDIAQQITTDEAEFMFSDGDSSVLVRPMEDTSTVFLLMPMRA